MVRGLKFVAVALAVFYASEPALAQYQPNIRVTQDGQGFGVGLGRRQAQDYGEPDFAQQLLITPSQAASIAQSQVPGSKVVKVRRRGGVFVVTLRTADSVVKVLISGADGSVL